MEIVAQVRRHAAAGWRHRWKALALAWLICLVGWSAVHLLPNQYRAVARIYADADAILGMLLRGIAIDSSPAGQVEILQRTLLSRPNLERVIARTDLGLRAQSNAEREELLQRLARQIRIVSQTRNLFGIEYQDHDPRLARDVVQTALDLFMEAATGTDRRQMENARQFVTQQLNTYEEQMREAERRRAEFQARYADLLALDGNVSRLEAVRAQRQALRGQLQDALTRRSLLQRQIEATPAMLTGAAAAVGGGEAPLAEAERTLRQLRQRFTEEHPDVIAARHMVAALRGAGGGRGATATPVAPRPNPLHEQLMVRLVETDVQIASLERQVQDAEAEFERLDDMARSAPEVQAQFTNLDRDYNVIRRNYEELLARREAIQIADAARTSSDRVKLEIVDPPILPSLPVGPNRKLLAAGVLLAGLGAGAALAFLLVQLDGAFYTARELRRLGLPVLGGLSAPPDGGRSGEVLVFAGTFGLLLLAFAAAMGGPDMLARLIA